MKQKMTNNVVAYPCNKCEYKYPKTIFFKKQKQNNHAENKYYCNECDFQAIQKGNLRTSKVQT